LAEVRSSEFTSVINRWRVALSGNAANIGISLIVGAFAYLSGSLAQMLSWQLGGIAVLCPASGIAAGAMVALARPAGLYIASGAAAATGFVAWEAECGTQAILLLAACNFAQCYMFRAAMRLLDPSRSQLESFRGVASFLAAALFASTVPAIPAAWLTDLPWLSGQAPAQDLAWAMFLSDFFGIIIIAPIIIAFPSLLGTLRRPWLLAESLLALSAAVAGGTLVFMFPPAQLTSVVPPAVVMFPLLLWLAARTPPFFCALGAFLVAVVVVAAAMNGVGRFAHFGGEESVRLMSAKLSLFTASCATLSMSAMFTKAKNVAEALRSSEQRLQLALDAGQMFAFDHDTLTGVVRRSGDLISKLGLKSLGSKEEYVNALLPADWAAYSRIMASLSPEDPQAISQLRVAARDGSIVIVEFRWEAEFDAARRLVRVRGVCVDVTERETALRKVEEQAEQLSTALQAGRVFAFEYASSDRRVTRTDNASQILGIPIKQVRENRNVLMELVHPDDKQALIDYSKDMSPAAPFKRQTLRFVRPDGRQAWLELMSTATFDSSGDLLAIKGLARDVTEQVRAEQRQQTLVRELDHRVKNALARMAVVIELSRDGHGSLEDFVAVVQGRIQSMAKTHERLSRSAWAGIDVGQIVSDELAAYRTRGNCTIEGPKLTLEPLAAQGLAFTVHELATNAVKHGALSKTGGRVDVVWAVTEPGGKGSALRLWWREYAPGLVSEPLRESYGLKTIRNLLQYEVEGHVRLEFKPHGLECTISIPLPATADAPVASTAA